uniref:Uncharacterized protein n=1 Tax=Aegilops tauschii subsp. strangulata TaxID=200361 RepID=A0A453J5N7_AEGTS
MDLQMDTTSLLMTDLGDMHLRPRSWTSTRARSYSGNVEGARTSCLRGMRTL